MLFWNAGIMGRKEQLLEAIFWTNEEQQGGDCHVATSARRDVSSKICISSLNARGLEKEGHREAYDERHGFQEPEDPDFESFPGIRTVFRFC